MRSHSELFLRDARAAADSAMQERLGFIVEGAARIDALADGLVAYSLALQTDPASFQSVRMDILLRLALAKLDQELRACRGEVVAGDLPVVSGNADRLLQVFEILLRNAVVHRGAPAAHPRRRRRASGRLALPRAG